MTTAHAEHAIVAELSNAWFALDPTLWYVGLELAKALDRTLLACIYGRLREVRDDVAREAFTRRLSIGQVARERLARLRCHTPEMTELTDRQTLEESRV